MKWLPLLFLLSALLFSAADIAYYYDQLPPQMASHFDIQGNADGWCTKQQFVDFAVISFVVLTVVLIAVTWLLRVVPCTAINLPNKGYWLAPEREAETRAVIVRWCVCFFATTMWFLALMLHDTIWANLRQPAHLEMIWWLVAGYLALDAIMLIRLGLHFVRKPNVDF